MKIDPSTWIPTLLFVAALALLPAWIVGGAALGIAVALWAVVKARKRAARALAVAREKAVTEAQQEQGRGMTFAEVDEMLYRHERPLYAYDASGAGADPRQDSHWRIKRDVLVEEWHRLCPYSAKEKVIPISKGRKS